MFHADDIPTPLIRVEHRVEPGGIVVTVSGEIDMVTAPKLEQQLARAIKRTEPPKPVVTDLRAVGFFGSAGINTLVQAQQRCEDHHTPLHVVATTHTVLRPLEICGLDEYLNLYERADKALIPTA